MQSPSVATRKKPRVEITPLSCSSALGEGCPELTQNHLAATYVIASQRITALDPKQLLRGLKRWAKGGQGIGNESQYSRVYTRDFELPELLGMNCDLHILILDTLQTSGLQRRFNVTCTGNDYAL